MSASNSTVWVEVSLVNSLDKITGGCAEPSRLRFDRNSIGGCLLKDSCSCNVRRAGWLLGVLGVVAVIHNAAR